MFRMIMKAILLPAFAAAALSWCLVSCEEMSELTGQRFDQRFEQKRKPAIPEMPYRPRTDTVAEQEEPQQQTEQEDTWNTYFSNSEQIPDSQPKAPDPKPIAEKSITAKSAPIPEPIVTPAPEKKAEPIKPIRPLEESPITAPAPSEPKAPESVVTPTTPPASPSTSAADLKNITNNGPIPTAARVEGDPTRVWNPLDPSKKIRIINPKTNQPYPSGKKLKVRGTNFQFYVP